jgi:hypothetical protein
VRTLATRGYRFDIGLPSFFERSIMLDSVAFNAFELCAIGYGWRPYGDHLESGRIP